MAKIIRLKEGDIKIESCVSDCPLYRSESCGCKWFPGYCGNDPRPQFTPPLPGCPLEDLIPQGVSTARGTTTYLDKEKMAREEGESTGAMIYLDELNRSGDISKAIWKAYGFKPTADPRQDSVYQRLERLEQQFSDYPLKTLYERQNHQREEFLTLNSNLVKYTEQIEELQKQMKRVLGDLNAQHPSPCSLCPNNPYKVT